MTFLLALYFPSRWFKRIPSQRDVEAVELFYKKAEALIVINPRRFFIEFFFFHATVVHFDLTRFKLGAAIFAGASALFSFLGLSPRIGKRILESAKPRLAPDDAKQWVIFDVLHTQHFFLTGQWNEVIDYDEELVKRNLRIGETFWASLHYYWHGLPKIYQGDFVTARLLVTKLSEIAEAYDNDIYRLLKYLLNTQLLLECRQLKEGAAEADRGIDLVQRNSWPQSALTIYSLEASLHLLMKETEKARAALDKAGKIKSDVKAAPIQLSFFYRSQFDYYLRCVETSLENGRKEEYSDYREKAVKSGKMLMNISRKAALYRTESYRLMGVYKWLLHDQKSALNWWRKGVGEGERLGARPQVARTCAEMGMRRCSDAQSSEADKNNARELIGKAISMFQNLGLDYDVENLSSVIGQTEL